MNTPPEENTNVDIAAEITRRAYIAFGSSHQRGSRSPFYEACAQQFISVLAREIVALADVEGRPLLKVSYAASKALALLQSAILNLNDHNEE